MMLVQNTYGCDVMQNPSTFGDHLVQDLVRSYRMLSRSFCDHLVVFFIQKPFTITEKAEVLSMKNHTTQHLHYDDTFGDCTYSFHISIIVLEIAHTVFDSTATMTAHTVFVTAPK